MTAPQQQPDKFTEPARAFKCDEVEAAFDAKLRDVAKHKPLPENPK